MTVLGVGVDIVDIARFESALARTPALRSRLFGPSDIDRPAQSLAARFAAKEAVLKALGGHIPGFSWHDIEVSGEPQQRPDIVLSGGTQRAAADRGVTHHHVSLSHDGGMAIAFVIAEGRAS